MVKRKEVQKSKKPNSKTAPKRETQKAAEKAERSRLENLKQIMQSIRRIAKGKKKVEIDEKEAKPEKEPKAKSSYRKAVEKAAEFLEYMKRLGQLDYDELFSYMGAVQSYHGLYDSYVAEQGTAGQYDALSAETIEQVVMDQVARDMKLKTLEDITPEQREKFKVYEMFGHNMATLGLRYQTTLSNHMRAQTLGTTTFLRASWEFRPEGG